MTLTALDVGIRRKTLYWFFFACGGVFEIERHGITIVYGDPVCIWETLWINYIVQSFVEATSVLSTGFNASIFGRTYL